MEIFMKMIVAADRKGGIGYQGRLLASLPTDMKYFREQTTGHTVIMGRATLESFPGGKPLPKRRNVVLSTTMPPKDGCEICRSVEEVLDLLRGEDPDDLYVIGGGSVYRAFLPHCDEILITEIDAVFEADTFIDLPSEDPAHWTRMSCSDPVTENGVTFSFAVYRRRS